MYPTDAKFNFWLKKKKKKNPNYSLPQTQIFQRTAGDKLQN